MEEARPAPSEPTVEAGESEVVKAAEVGQSETPLTELRDALGCGVVWYTSVLVAVGILVLLSYPPASGMVVFLVALTMFVAVLYGIARWIVGPLDRAAKRVAARLQFTIIDFLCLFFLIQMPMALIHGFFKADEGLRWVYDIYAWLAFGALWLASVNRLSRAGVYRPGQRALFLAFVLPSAVFGTVLAPLLPFAFLAELARGGALASSALAAGVEAILLAAIYASGLVTRRMVARAAEAGEKP